MSFHCLAPPLLICAIAAATGAAAQDVAFFEARVLPVLKARCFECHSHEQKIKGGLTLDSKSGWEKGGESGPAIVPGKPELSLLIQAVSHVEKDLQMPPKTRLPLAEIDLLKQWVSQGAPDPRAGGETVELAVDDAWQVEFQKRLDWWSLKPMRRTGPPAVNDPAWSKEPVDRFVRAALDAAKLAPAPPAEHDVLRRRLSLVLTGLPPAAHELDSSYESQVETLLSSPHFGERFARHWMDVVRYTDTYGYEWDNPAKGAHEYRDYLIRAFNDDIGFDQLVREQIAGDLLPKPRINHALALNESLIGPMFYHMGEHRHGSSLMFNGIHQEMVNNKIDAFSKAFLATTVACARCHDHKLEAVSQREYYALAAMFTTPRWTSRIIDSPAKNDAAIATLKDLRSAIRDQIAQAWRSAGSALHAPALRDWAIQNRSVLENTKPGDIADPLSRLLNSTVWLDTQDLRASAASSTLTVAADRSILAVGTAPETDRYTIRFTTGSGKATTLRLEALSHPSLPAGGPGRTDRGNFVLSNLRIEVSPFSPDGKAGPPRQIGLASARASYSQPNYAVENLLKPSPSRGWAVGLAPQGLDHTATFTLAEPLELPHGGEWTVTLEQPYGSQHVLGRFRLTPGCDTQAGPSDAAIATLWPQLVQDWQTTRARRRAANAAFKPLSDLPAMPKGWVIEGDGMKHGFVGEATPLIALEGDAVIARLLPRGYHTHALSSKLPGSLRLPPQHAVPGGFVSLNLAGGEFGAYLVVDDHAFQNETFGFLTHTEPQWKSFADAGLKNGVQQVTVEFATSSLNPNFPPRTGLAKGLKASDFGYDKRSWFSVTGLVSHEAGGMPENELDAFTGLYDAPTPKTADKAWNRIAAWLGAAVTRWCDSHSQSGDRPILDWLLARGLLPNDRKPCAALVDEYRRVEAGIPFPRSVNSMDEREVLEVRYPLNVRGNVDVTGALVTPGFLKMLDDEHVSGRLELATSLLHPEHALTARVYVNRVWQWLFGTGLVATPDDFGRLGDKPSHPELLDWLAREFIREGWSTKKLVRRLVLSRTFRQSGTVTAAAREVDPANRLLHHYPTRRLEAEAIRDSLLAVSGRLDPQLYGRPILPFRSAEDDNKRLLSGALDGNGRRSIYLQMSIMEPPRFLAGFNLPDLKLPTGRRDVTNVPSQALIMLNDPFVRTMAKHWAGEVMEEPATSPEDRIRRMFERAFARQPSAAELQRWTSALHDFGGTSADAWTRLAHAFFNTKEFLYYR